MDYYDVTQLIENLEIILSSKEKELEELQKNTSSDILTNIKINQLNYEIDELRMQLAYHHNKMTDQLLNNCVNYSNGSCADGSCCNYKFF